MDNDAARERALAALDDFREMRRQFHQGAATYEQAVAAAEAYRAILAERKAAEPAKFKRLAIPSVAQLMR